MPIQELKFPDQFINRKVERDIFGELLQFQNDARLLAIEDKEGSGKSALLKMLRYQSLYLYKRPVGIVPLEEPTVNNSPFAFIDRLRKSFGNRGEFANFDERNKARIKRVAQGSPMMGSIDMRNAAVSGQGNEFVGQKVDNSGTIIYANSNAWGPEQDELAKQECIEGFLEDLRVGGEMVILMDSYEQCGLELQGWILEEFLETLCFKSATRPDRLVLVLAGRELPDFEAILDQPKYQQLVRSRALSEWEEDHVKEFLKVHGHEDLSEEDVEYVWTKVKKGVSIAAALNLASVIKMYR
jgi:hypothetical protein